MLPTRTAIKLIVFLLLSSCVFGQKVNLARDTTGTLPHAQLPTLLSTDIPALPYDAAGAAAGIASTLATPQNVQQQTYSYATDTGAANAYAVTLSPVPLLVAGEPVIFKAAHANTGASTLAVNGGSAIAIFKQGGSTVLASGDIVAGQAVRVTFDGTNFQMQSQLANAPSGLPAGVTSDGANGLKVTGAIAVGLTVLDPINGVSAPTIASSGPVTGSDFVTNLNGANATGMTDVSVAVNAAIAANVKRILLPPGKFYVPALSNPLGVQIKGDGVLTGPVNQVSQYGALNTTIYGTRAQISSYSFWDRFTAGQEYMNHWFGLVQAAWAGTYSPGKIVLSGDSTTSGVNVYGLYMPEQMLTLGLQAKGVPYMTVINAGHSGMCSSQWLSTYLAQDLVTLATNPGVYVLRWGINDITCGLTPAQSVANLRAGLAQIRPASFKCPTCTGSLDVDSLSIVLETPSSTDDSPNGRDASYYEQMTLGVAQTGRDFQTGFVDLYGLMPDSSYAPTSTSNTCWMDSPYAAVGTSTPPVHIHPGPCKQPLYTSYLLDFLVPSGLNGLAANLFTNISYADNSTITPSIAPAGFGHGISFYRATAANGWQVDGFVETHSHLDGDVMQFNYPNSSTSSTYSFRAGTLSGGWAPWVSSATGGSGGSMVYPAAGIPQSTGVAWGASLPLQGTGTKVLSSSTMSGTASPLCTDATGAATTVGCSTSSLSSTENVVTASSVTAALNADYYNHSAGALTVNAPVITTGTTGQKLCTYNDVGNSGAMTLQIPAATYANLLGVNSSAGAQLVSAGALGDSVCLKAQTTSQYFADPGSLHGSWTIVNSAAATPAFSPVAGAYFGTQTVAVTSATSGATNCVTTDGTTPTATTPGTCSHGSTVSNGGTLSVSTAETLEALATKTAFLNSGVATGAYTFLQDLDTFAGTTGTLLTAHMGDAAHTWTVDSGDTVGGGTITLTGSGGATSAQSGAGTFAAVLSTTTPSSANYKVSADVTAVNGSSYYFNLYGRYVTATPVVYFLKCATDYSGCELFAYNGGTTQIGSTYPFTWVNGATHNIALGMVGTTITAYLDGVSIISGTSSASNAVGQAGFQLNDGESGNSGITIKNWKIQ
jgi:hypothetical protein